MKNNLDVCKELKLFQFLCKQLWIDSVNYLTVIEISTYFYNLYEGPSNH